jgi:hypothetical protein
MAGYLEGYGAGVDRRLKIIKTVVIAVVVLAVVGGWLMFAFHNYREERQVKQFLARLEANDFKGAYSYFGCTEAAPCRLYPFERFLEDWGPASDHKSYAGARISRSRSCGSGVLLTVDYANNQQEKLWVETKDMSVGFPPVQGCPAHF